MSLLYAFFFGICIWVNLNVINNHYFKKSKLIIKTSHVSLRYKLKLKGHTHRKAVYTIFKARIIVDMG